MILYHLLFILAIHLFNIKCTEESSNFVNDYCWRDYNGITPSDALRAGVDRNGNPIYIGQTLYNNKLIPGKIHENVQGIHIEFFEAFLINETIKILCTKQPEKFEWYKTRYNDIINIKHKHLFEGGYEKGVRTYIGRAQSHGELTVGKVICWTDRCIKLTTIENGTWHDHEEFEILTHKSNIPQENASSSDSSTKSRNSPSFLTYFFLVLGTAVLVVLVIVLIRRC